MNILKSLKDAHEILKKENIENLKEIEDLKLQVALLVHTRSSETVPHESKDSKGSQTDFKEEFTCQVCVFQGKSKEDLKLHTENEHSSDKPVHMRKYTCNICGHTVNEK